MMEISKTDIVATIMKFRQAGKRLPQADRIKCATDKATEEQKVLAETIQLFCQLFLGKGININAWNKALDRAMLRYDMNSSIITPGLMQTCLEEINKEAIASNRYDEVIDEPAHDKETCYAGLSAIKWTFTTMKERASLYHRGINAIGKFKRDKKQVISNAIECLGISREEAEKYLVLLMCWDNDLQFSKATGTPAKTFIAFEEDGRLRLMYQ